MNALLDPNPEDAQTDSHSDADIKPSGRSLSFSLVETPCCLSFRFYFFASLSVQSKSCALYSV